MGHLSLRPTRSEPAGERGGPRDRRLPRRERQRLALKNFTLGRAAPLRGKGSRTGSWALTGLRAPTGLLAFVQCRGLGRGYRHRVGGNW